MVDDFTDDDNFLETSKDPNDFIPAVLPPQQPSGEAPLRS